MKIHVTRNRAAALSLSCMVVIGAMALSASAQLLVYEPFNYGDDWLNGKGGALGTTGTWATTDSGEANGWRAHPAGLSGVFVSATEANVFDGTVANLQTSGGYAGMPGPEDRGQAAGSDTGSGNLEASIGLAPSVTATFQSGTTTWFSFVSVHAWDRNQGAPQFMIGTDPMVAGSRGLTMQNSGSGIGGGGGLPRFNLQDTYPQYFVGGIDNHAPGGYNNDPHLGNGLGTWGTHDGEQTIVGSGNDNTADGQLDENGQPRTQTMPWVSRNDAGEWGAPNIIVGKIEWDADTGGEDVISLVGFVETDLLTEAAFDAQISALPQLSSKNWGSNKPNLDQSQFDTVNFSSLKYFVDEIRIAQSFDDAVPASVIPEPSVFALLALGGLLLVCRRRK